MINFLKLKLLAPVDEIFLPNETTDVISDKVSCACYINTDAINTQRDFRDVAHFY